MKKLKTQLKKPVIFDGRNQYNTFGLEEKGFEYYQIGNLMKILVTGAAGFIGYHLCEALIAKGFDITGLDNINDYYDVDLKYARLKQLGLERENVNVYNTIVDSEFYGSQMQFIRMNLEDRDYLPIPFKESQFDLVCNLQSSRS